VNLPKVHISLVIALMTLPLWGWSQQTEATISYGNTTVELDEKFTIKIVIRAKDYDVSDFPEIKGFTKGGRSVAHASFRKNGSKGIEHTITQNYIPKKPGTFKLSPTVITINDQERNLLGEIISVSSKKKYEKYAADSLQADIINIDEKEDAQLFLNTSKDSVFVGQGFKVTVGFYVSDLNTVGWDFPPDLNSQVEVIAQTIKPGNCLESRKEITSITPQRTRINGRGYSQYTVFEAIYYPLNTKSVTFKPVALTMIKTGIDSENNAKRTFNTKSGNLGVKPLPEHPLKDKVPVGNFYLREWLTKGETETGVSVSYEFRIIGEGNFATVNFPTPENDARFDFYPSEVKNNIKEGSLSGDRAFKYMVFPKDSGKIALDNYFKFIFFNVKKADYDTLSSSVTLSVSGEKITSTSRRRNDIYAGLEDINSADIPINYRIILKNIANVLIVSMMITLLFMMRNRNTG
jgi:hypothetical protein